MLKIVYVDDSKFALTTFKNVLCKVFEECDVFSYITAEFHELMKNGNKFTDTDILITDLLMPNVSGHEILKYVRSGNKNIFLVVLSSNVQNTEKQLTFENGSNYFIEKPVTIEKLKKTEEAFNAWKNTDIVDFKVKDAMQKLINTGLEKAANVISELVGSYVKLGVANIYSIEGLHQLLLFSSYVVVQDITGEILKGKVVFSMFDDEFLKLLKYLDVIEDTGDYHDTRNLDMILDSYQEIGNIILGNIISVIADNLGDRVEMKLPYISEKNIFEDFKEAKYIIVDVIFSIDKLNAKGKLCLINSFATYQKLSEFLTKM